MLADILTFFGRLHPLIVHTPIGFLLLATIFDFASYNRRYRHLRSAVPFTLLLGLGAATTACVLGYLLSGTGDYDEQLLDNHMASGISLTVLAAVLYVMTTRRGRSIISIPRPLFSSLSLVSLLLLGYTGHQGGSLTHGSDYLSMEILTREVRTPPAHADDAMVFEDIVHPVLEKKCFQCHRDDKKKGRLSLESLASMLNGGKHGPSVVPGDLERSELFRRISLDPSEEAFMPPDGKTPLTTIETEMIRWWIAEGEAVTGKKISELDGYKEIRPAVDAFLGSGGDRQTNIELADSSTHAGIPDTLHVESIERLRVNGLVVRVMSHKPAMLDVTLPSRSGKRMEEIEDDLMRISANVIWLNLSDNNFTEHDLDILQHFPNVERIRLEKNPISDGISQYLEGLKHLEVVNLNQTRITCACLTGLKRNDAIKRVYTWKTICDRQQ